jgi:hypothetical protein
MKLVALRRTVHDLFGLTRTRTPNGAVRLAVYKFAFFAPPNVSREAITPSTL